MAAESSGTVSTTIWKTVISGAALEMATDAVAVSAAPRASVTMSVARYVPSSGNAWVVVTPYRGGEPGSNRHSKRRESPSASLDPLPSKVMTEPSRPWYGPPIFATGAGFPAGGGGGGAT